MFASSSLFEHCLNVIGRGIQQGQIKVTLCASNTLTHLFRFVHLLVPSHKLSNCTNISLTSVYAWLLNMSVSLLYNTTHTYANNKITGSETAVEQTKYEKALIDTLYSN